MNTQMSLVFFSELTYLYAVWWHQCILFFSQFVKGFILMGFYLGNITHPSWGTIFFFFLIVSLQFRFNYFQDLFSELPAGLDLLLCVYFHLVTQLGFMTNFAPPNSQNHRCKVNISFLSSRQSSNKVQHWPFKSGQQDGLQRAFLCSFKAMFFFPRCCVSLMEFSIYFMLLSFCDRETESMK